MDKQHYYNVTEVLFNTPTSEKPYDITASMYELVLTESVNRAFLTGRITVLDDKKLYDTERFSGVETIRVTIEFNNALMKYPPQPPIVKTFVMRNIRLAQDINTESRAVVFDLIEPHGFANNNKKISRSFTDTPTKIIEKIMNQIGVTVNGDGGGTTQEDMRYITPYISPIAAAEVIKDRITSNIGSPFFLTSSIFDDENNVRLISFDTAMTKHPVNEPLPYIYSQAQTNYDDIPEAAQPFVVGKFFEENLEDTFKFTQQGGLLNEYKSFDSFQGRTSGKRVFVGEHLNAMIGSEILRGDNQIVYNENYDWSDANPKEVHAITSGKSFPDIKNIHDVNGTSDGAKKIKPMQILASLERGAKKISVRGLGIMLYRISAGQSLSVRILDTQQEKPLKDTDGKEGFDVRRSGNYFIMETKHIFRYTDHVVNLKIAKFDDMVFDEGPQ